MVKKDEAYDGPSAFRLASLFGVIVIVLPFVVDFLGGYITRLLQTFAPEDAATLLANAYLQDIVVYGLLTAILLFYLKATLEPLASYGWTWKKDYLALAAGIGVLSGLVMYGIDIATGFDFSTMPPFSVTAFFGVMIGAAILPALFEETFFRGVIQTAYWKLTKRTVGPIALAIIAASAFEILFHVVFPLYNGSLGLAVVGQVVYVAVFGGIGGYLYYRTGSLVTPIVIHVLGNFTEYALVWFLR